MLAYAGRAISASPAVGYAAKHNAEQKQLIEDAFADQAQVRRDGRRALTLTPFDTEVRHMRIEVKVPQLPESVAEATLVSWHKKAGEAVTRDENLIDIETDKVVLELPAPGDGVLVEIVKADGVDGHVERGDRGHRHRGEGAAAAPPHAAAAGGRGRRRPRPRRAPAPAAGERDGAARRAQDDGGAGRRSPRPSPAPAAADASPRATCSPPSQREGRAGRRAAPPQGAAGAGGAAAGGARHAPRAARADVAAARSASPSASCSRSRRPRS